ncbi:MAG: 2-isopropylmalate synthase [archaeon]|nr:2-isopropylmalate synthase [archaeon]MCP8306186.1 2-isopropylmalate synthase [archaeon]
MSSEDYIKIFDTTLRDGEQTPGVSLTPEDKLEIARLLDKLGVDTIEAGFPIVSKGEIEGVKLIVKEGLKAEICALARVDKGDIDAALDCGVGCIHVFVATSDIHLKYKLKLTQEQALQKAIEGVEYAKSHGVQVEFSAEDATRSDLDFLKQVYRAVEEVGADRIDIPDTVGIITPIKMYQLVGEIKEAVRLPVSLHCHDDFGMAVANTLAGIEAGAVRAHVTINGLGERAGNAALEEVVMALHSLYGKKTRINTQQIYETSKLVSELTGITVQPNKAIVGDNAFSHESGIHVHGILSTPLTYEPIMPEMVGRKRWLQAGKHAGGHGIAAKLEEMGWQPTKDQLREIVERVKDLGDKGKAVTDTDLSAIARFVMRKAAEEEKIIDLVDLAVITGIKVVPTASVKIILDGKEYVAAETGVGPVDSAVRAIQNITDRLANIKLKEYRLAAITGGSDALAEVIIKVEDKDGNVASARAAGEDVVIASVEALIDGINKILIKRKRSQSLAT